MMSKTPGQIAYESLRRDLNPQCPFWPELAEHVQSAWEAAAVTEPLRNNAELRAVLERLADAAEQFLDALSVDGDLDWTETDAALAAARKALAGKPISEATP